jgi:isopentenyl diphosphate isomerase/L-lactate dehydrogenase-like FMN-dependent dehydrogenase
MQTALSQRTPPADVPVDIAGIEARALTVMSEQHRESLTGTDDEWTLRRNVAALNAIRLRTSRPGAAGTPDLRTTVLGAQLDMPILAGAGPFIAFYGRAGFDVYAATTAARTAMVVNLGTPSADIAGAGAGVRFRQLLFAGHEATQKLVETAVENGERAIFLTVDVVGSPFRTRETHFEMRQNPVSWSERIKCHLRPVLKKDRIPDYDPAADRPEGFRHPEQNWNDIARMRKYTPVPLVLKGILTAEDARLAREHGVDGIVVSNHGGRAQDRVPATIEVLPEIVDAVGGKMTVLVDSGFRSGAHVLKALALGADAVLIVRPIFWSLAALQADGPRLVFDVLRRELSDAMTACGCRSLADISADLVEVAAHV